MPDAPASSSRPSTWEEHVSHPLLFDATSLLVCLLFVLQPFDRALVEAGKAFFEMEREKNALHHVLEFGASKCFDCVAKTL